jgi:hypothetical protein
LIIVGGIIGGLKIIEHNEEQKRKMEEAQEIKRIQETYQKFNYSVFMAIGDDEVDLPWDGKYAGTYVPDPESNPYGISCSIYLALKLYEKETGKFLAYETVMEYMAEEYEPDGTLRLYNNGKHPEVEGYVEWAWGDRKKIEKYMNRLSGLYYEYRSELEEDVFKGTLFYSLSPQMYDELAKKEADPNYEMDLLSLQEQGL